jgi:hypothetical protein
MRVDWLDRLELTERLIRASGGISLRLIQQATGMSLPAAHRAVRYLIETGAAQWDPERREERTNLGRPGRLVIPAVKPSQRAVPSRPGREEVFPAAPLGNPDEVVLDAPSSAHEEVG